MASSIMGDATRPEELMNSYLKLRAATKNIANGLGVLALLWSTVVLLGGFVSILRVKELWVLSVMSFLMASRMLNFIVDEELYGPEMFNEGLNKWFIYVEESRIIRIIERLERIEGRGYLRCLRITFTMLLVAKVIVFLCPVLALLFVPFVSLGISVWRLVQRDYGNASGDIANIAKLAAALEIFYVLVLFLCLFVIYWWFLVVVSGTSVFEVVSLTSKQRGYEKWIPKVVAMYYKETTRKCNKDGKLPGNWNLITYGAGLLQSASGEDDDDHLMWGARLLDKLCDNKDIISVRQELLSSRSSIRNLIGMICRRGTADSVESRERAARILAHLASDLHITHFPGTLQGICSLLESCHQFCEPQVTCPSSSEKSPDEQNSWSLQTSNHQHDAHTLVPIQDQTNHEQQVDTYQQQYKDIKEWRRYTYRSRGAKELFSQGLLILEGLTRDQVNCMEIRRHQLLLYKIKSPLRSPYFLNNLKENAMVEMLSKSLTVVSRLLTSHGDGATRLRQELASTTEAVSNLMAILEIDSRGVQELQGQALEILMELAFDDSFKKLDFNKLFKVLLCIFLEEASSNNTAVRVVQADRENATRLMRGKSGEALARLLPICTARGVDAAHILSKQETINLLTKVLNQILSSKMETTTDAVEMSVTEMGALMAEAFNKKMGKNVCAKAVTKTQNQVAEKVINQILCSKMGITLDAAKRAFTINENLPTEVLDEILSSKMETVAGILQPLIQVIEKQSEERKFLAAILSVAVVICNENVISKEEFARAIPEDAALVEKLTEILKVNNHSTAQCLRVVKLACQVVIAMIQVKPSCITHFNEHNFNKELTEALKTMSEVDECMLYVGNDHDEVIKPARSLVSLVKEAQELLNTQPKDMVIGISA